MHGIALMLVCAAMLVAGAEAASPGVTGEVVRAAALLWHAAETDLIDRLEVLL